MQLWSASLEAHKMNHSVKQAHLLACHECDLLINLEIDIATEQDLVCPRCKNKITAHHKNPLDHTIALSITALLLLIAAASFPFMSFEVKGQSSTINLIDSAQALYQHGYPILALLILCFIVAFPTFYLLALLIVTVPVKLGLHRSPPVALGRLLNKLLPWAMTEVFLTGVLVALIKIIALANIVMGISFWAYIMFTVAFIHISNIVDSHRLWGWIEFSVVPIRNQGHDHG